jgi:large subunit ribosomal protein L25
MYSGPGCVCLAQAWRIPVAARLSGECLLGSQGLLLAPIDHETRERPVLFPLHSAAVAGERIKLEVAERERGGSRESRRLRKQGLIPGVIYGGGKTPHSISVPERELRRVLTGGSGMHAILDVVLEGQKTARASILKDYQQDPIRGTIIHVDLQEVRLDQPIQAQVVVELTGGDAGPGVKEGGVLSQVTREVTVEALPMEIPDHLELDVSGMALGDTLRVADLQVREGMTLLDDPETVLANVSAPRVEEVVEEAEEAEGEVEEAAEGEAAPAEGSAGDSSTEG